jgi:toxin ParE1/3/4
LFDAIRLTLTQIAKIPKIGVSYPFQNSRLTGLRKLQVKDFSNYIIFYLEKSEQIEVVRILHGAGNIGCDLQLINHRCVRILAFANSQYDF